MSQQGLNVVMVGATGGIGAALLNRLLQIKNIHSLFICGRRQPDNLVDGGRFLPVDFLEEATIAAAANVVKESGVALDLIIVATGVLHDNRGLQPEKSLRQLSPDNFLKAMAVNALGPALVAKYFLPLLNKQARTCFVALSARVGSISDNGLGGWHSYRASKAALNMLIKTVAIEYRRRFPKAIIVGLHPGTVATELSRPFRKNVPQQKLFTPDYAAEQLLAVIDRLQMADSGDCFAWDGQKIPA